MKKKSLVIIAHLYHYKKDGRFYSYEPYVREIELWSDLFDEITIYTDLQKEFKPTFPVKELPENCKVKDIWMRSGSGLKNNLIRMIQLPFATVRLFFILSKAEMLHFRSPGITAMISNFLNRFLNKKTIVKWATQFDFIPPLSQSQRFELKLLKNPPSNTKVLIYGKAEHQNHVSFFPAIMSKEELDELRQKIQPRDWTGKIRLVSVGRLYRHKNFDTIIEGLIVFKQKYPDYDWEFVMIGDGEERNHIEDMIKKGNLENEVKLPGSRPFGEVLEWYGKSHIAVMPGKYEGWPKVVNEAWATGCIPFVVNYGNAPYPLTFAENSGFSYEANPESFADSLNEILQKPADELDRIRKNGADANYSMTLEKFKEKINQIILTDYDTRKDN